MKELVLERVNMRFFVMRRKKTRTGKETVKFGSGWPGS